MGRNDLDSTVAVCVHLYTEMAPWVLYLHSIYIALYSVSHKSNQYIDINNSAPVVHTSISHKHSLHTYNSFIIEQNYMELLRHYMSKCVQQARKRAPLVNWLN